MGIAPSKPLRTFNDDHSKLLMTAVRNEQLAGEEVCARVASLLSNPDISANVNVQDDNNNTALHYACWKGHTAVVKLLLDAGADINMTNRAGSTPLHSACGNGHLQSVKALLAVGASTQTMNFYCTNCCRYCCKQLTR